MSRLHDEPPLATMGPRRHASIPGAPVSDPETEATHAAAPGEGAPQDCAVREDGEPPVQESDPAGSMPDDQDPQRATDVPATAALQPAGTTTAERPPAPRRRGVFVDVEDLRAHVSDLLRTIVGGHGVDRWGNFSFDHDSTRVFVTVRGGPVGPVVGIFSVLATDLDLTESLAAWMATTNHRLLFGSLSWDESNDAVWLRHNLLGSHLDAPELGAAVQAVASTAGMLDDQVATRYGGVRFADRPGARSDGRTQDGPDASDEDLEQASPDELRPPNASGYL